MAADPGTPSSPRRQRWWDEVISKAFSIQNIAEIREPSTEDIVSGMVWRDPDWLGGTTATREATWLTLNVGGVDSATGFLTKLGLAVKRAADANGWSEAPAWRSPLAPFNTLNNAASNMDFLVGVDARMPPLRTPSRAADPIPEVPTAPPCAPDEPLYPQSEDCTFDPSYTLPDWTTQGLPFLNSRDCEYYVPIRTSYPCPGADELPLRVEEYLPEAITALMDFLNKDYAYTSDADIVTPSTIATNSISAYVLDREAYEFDKTPGRNLKLLYKIPLLPCQVSQDARAS